MEAALKAIAAPRRRQILSLVRDRELSAGEIAARFDVTRPAVSQHLNVLKEAGLISERRNGTRRLYRARPEGLFPLKTFLEEFWDGRLETLRHEIEREEHTVEMTTETSTIERELAIAARPEAVWEFLVDPVKMTRWMGQTAALDPRPGGAYRVVVIPGEIAVGEVVEIDPPRRLVFTWGWEPGGRSSTAPGSTTVEFELAPSGAGTTLKFRHRDLPVEEAAQAHEHGWNHYLERLRVAAGGGDPGPDPWASGQVE